MPELNTQNPEPGIYPGVPMSDYLAIPAASASGLWKAYTHSFAHLHAEMEEEVEEERKKSFDLGDSIHAAVLEPHRVEEVFAEADRCHAKKRDGDRCTKQGSVIRDGQAYCGTTGHDPNPGQPSEKIILSRAQTQQMRGAVAAVKAHGRAGPIFSSPGETELVMIWRDRGTGVLCKARIDKLARELRVMADLKTVGRSANPRRFGRDFWDFGYHIKQVHYLQAADALGLDADEFLFVVLETKGPHHGIVLGSLAPEDRDRAWVQHRDLMDGYARCLDAGAWPSYPPTVQVISLPSFARYQMDAEQDDQEAAA